MKIEQYLHLYLGCNTNAGQLVGVYEKNYFLRHPGNGLMERSFNNDPPVKLYLRKISDLNEEESITLNQLGLSIGRPRGYSFSPQAILYLLGLRIDLFNLISDGDAIDISK